MLFSLDLVGCHALFNQETDLDSPETRLANEAARMMAPPYSFLDLLFADPVGIIQLLLRYNSVMGYLLQ